MKDIGRNYFAKIRVPKKLSCYMQQLSGPKCFAKSFVA